MTVMLWYDRSDAGYRFFISSDSRPRPIAAQRRIATVWEAIEIAARICLVWQR